jgi:hypothetical protein
MCRSSAFFKNGSFYLNYVYTVTGTIARNSTSTCCRYKNFSNYSSVYNSETDTCKFSSGGNSANVGEDGDYGVHYTSCSGSGKGLVLPNICNNCDGSESDCGNYPRGALWPICTCSHTDSASCTASGPTDECEFFNHGCSGLVDCGICTQEDINNNDCDGYASAQYTAKITLLTPVTLYNSQGVEVGNIIGADYDPCNPLATWNAPGCHFFA